MEEYLSALEERDSREKGQVEYINACKEQPIRYNCNAYSLTSSIDTKLADRTATLEAASEKAPPSSPPPVPSTPSKAIGKQLVGGRTKSVSEEAASSDILSQLRIDLATTQKSRAELQARLKPLNGELEALKVKSGKDLRRVSELTRERLTLERKLRDRDEELKGKARLVEEVQDEMVSLNLQLNMAEQRSDKLERENKELVDRWMARMGKEADAMNDASKWS